MTSIKITDSRGPGANDNLHLPDLLANAVKYGWSVEQVSADKAYLSRANLTAIDEARAFPLIPFKSNSIGFHATGKGSEVWRKLYGFFMYRRDEFLTHYHKRSNVETTFHMIKSKFGASIRSKTAVA